jgi:hypothetical protein
LRFAPSNARRPAPLNRIRPRWLELWDLTDSDNLGVLENTGQRIGCAEFVLAHF